jgi:protein-S-isoprenylcysteine O-methyltransferase Ste14
MPQLSVSAAAFAWCGAAAFVVSLLWFLYCYFVRFDAIDGASTAGAIAWNVALFSAFALHHSVLARTAIKRRVQQIVPPALERSLYTWVSSLLFIAVCTFWSPVSGVLYRLPGPWRIVGYVVQGLGLAITIRAARRLDVLDLAGVRAVLRAGTGAEAPQHVPLETRGLYGFVRHPLYFAWTCLVFGTADMTATRAVFAVVSTAYLAIAIPFEERGLVQTFGADYETYRRRVRWRMMPGVY